MVYNACLAREGQVRGKIKAAAQLSMGNTPRTAVSSEGIASTDFAEDVTCHQLPEPLFQGSAISL